MSMRRIARHADVIAGMGIMPLQTAPALDKNLVATREDEEVLKVAVAVQRHCNSWRHDRTHHTDMLVAFRRHELNDRSENVQHQGSWAGTEMTKECPSGFG
ncbi:hypothetical protein A5707_13440 [Mycobacterium kyorinense]|uniref:Uncharacterized protein n=1 Tax=Mycobacterium kyorinense TaxID=487514 RepID=A0A1A2ZQG4_9MYCO|nr:hypothetical protein A5707_13440 [Mycobacterium kyorinense]